MAISETADGRERGDTLTRSQAARRRRVIDAALSLAAQGGYDAVQMRDVATTAQVALGTIYRYFSSKDQLLAASLVEWSRGLEQRLAQRPPRGDTMAERVIDVVGRASRAMEREPRLTSALVTAVAGPDPAVQECQRDVSQIMANMLAGPLEDLDEARRDGIVQVLGHVWLSSLLGWVNGWTTVGRVSEELDLAIRLLLP
jgi:AcrR family transcriptional regulator